MIRKRKYFELPLAPADILAEFDCTYERKRLDLPRYQGSINNSKFAHGLRPAALTKFVLKSFAPGNPDAQTFRKIEDSFKRGFQPRLKLELRIDEGV